MKIPILIGILSLMVLTVQGDMDKYQDFSSEESSGDGQFDTIDSSTVILNKLEKLDKGMKKIYKYLRKITKAQENSAKFRLIGSKWYYIENKEGATFADARDKCNSLGSKLATFANKAEFLAVSAELTERNYWIDVSVEPMIDSVEKEFGYRFQSGGDQPFLTWLAGEPNGRANHEDCVELRLHINHYGMNDDSCRNEYNFICQKN